MIKRVGCGEKWQNKLVRWCVIGCSYVCIYFCVFTSFSSRYSFISLFIIHFTFTVHFVSCTIFIDKNLGWQHDGIAENVPWVAPEEGCCIRIRSHNDLLSVYWSIQQRCAVVRRGHCGVTQRSQLTVRNTGDVDRRINIIVTRRPNRIAAYMWIFAAGNVMENDSGQNRSVFASHWILRARVLHTGWSRINRAIYFCCPSSVFLQQNR